MKINNLEIRDLDPIKTIAITHTGNYSGITTAFDRLTAWASVNNLWEPSPRMAGVYLDCPFGTPENELRSKACIEKFSEICLEEGMEYYEITGGKYLVVQAEVKMTEYAQAWQKAYDYFTEKGYETDLRDHYELYLTCVADVQDKDAVSVAEFCIPMK